MTPPSTDRKASSIVGKTLGDEFRIDAEIGAGGMSRVYLAHQLSVDRPVVVKVMLPPTRRADEWRARFMQEARVASKVRHPGIVTIYSFGEEADVGPYIAMEYVEGDSLRDLLDREGVIAPGRACSLMAQVCRAMHAAHAEGIVHRDLKPDNIMVDSRDEHEVARVLDFGVAKPADSVVNTLDEHIVGTPEYMAPEQSRKQPIDRRTDLYAAGIILYELVAGERPYKAPDALTLMFKHHSEPLPVDRLPDDVAATLKTTFEGACAKDPADRFADAKTLAEELERAARSFSPNEGAVVPPPPPLPPAEPGPPAGPTLRREHWIAAAAVVVIVLGIGVWRASTTPSRIEPVASPSPPPLVEQPATVPAPKPAAMPKDLFVYDAARWTVRSAAGQARVVASQQPRDTRTAKPPRANRTDDDFHRVDVPEPERPTMLEPFKD